MICMIVFLICSIYLFSTQPASHLPVWLDNVQEANLLCRVQSVGAECKNPIANCFSQPVVSLAETLTGHASTSKPQVTILVTYLICICFMFGFVGVQFIFDAALTSWNNNLCYQLSFKS